MEKRRYETIRKVETDVRGSVQIPVPAVIQKPGKVNRMYITGNVDTG
jgi:hypothetical protein